MRNALCACGRYHDHTGQPIVAVIDWHGKRWPILKGTRPYQNTDDLGGREYTACLVARGQKNEPGGEAHGASR